MCRDGRSLGRAVDLETALGVIGIEMAALLPLPLPEAIPLVPLVAASCQPLGCEGADCQAPVFDHEDTVSAFFPLIDIGCLLLWSA